MTAVDIIFFCVLGIIYVAMIVPIVLAVRDTPARRRKQNKLRIPDDVLKRIPEDQYPDWYAGRQR